MTAAAPIPLLIDCDPGIDDAIALLLAAASAELDLLAVTTVAGNRPVDVTTANAAALMALAGRGDVPVHAGCARPIASPAPRCNLVHGADGLGGVALPPTAPSSGHACDVIARVLLDAAPRTVTLLAVGPLTNLALAELRHPGLLARTKCLAVMGGAAFCPGNVTPQAEFNFWADGMAAQIVMSAGADVHLFGLDVTSKAVMSDAWIASLGRQASRCAQAAGAMLAPYAAADPLLHDACPVAWLIDPSLFSGERCVVSVDVRSGPTEGQTLAWPGDRDDRPFDANATVYTGVRAEGLMRLVEQRISLLA